MATKKEMDLLVKEITKLQGQLDAARNNVVKAMGKHAVNKKDPTIDIRIKDAKRILEELHTKH